MRIENIDKKGNMIQGRVGTWMGRFACKVYVYLFPHPCEQTNLVETICEFSWRQSPKEISLCLETLRRNFEVTMPDELKTLHRMRYLYIDGFRRPRHH